MSLARDPEETEREVLAALQRWLEAAREGDSEALDKLLTDSFSYTHASTGDRDERARWLDIFNPSSDRYRRYRAYDVTGVTVRQFPGIALVDGRGYQEIVRPNGHEVVLRTSFLCVWVEQEGRWLLAAWQATRIPDA